MNSGHYALLCLHLLLAGCGPNTATPLTVSKAYAYAPFSREAPGVAYFTLFNSTDAAVFVANFTSSCFASAELHSSVIDNGIMKMRHIESLEIAPQSSLSLQPGGLHLMLIGIKDSVAAGSHCELQVHFGNATLLSFTLQLLDRTPSQPAESM